MGIFDMWRLLDQIPTYVTALNGVVAALIALALLIPGDEPENTLRKIAEFLSKYSKK